jgi:hypothetical protein
MNCSRIPSRAVVVCALVLLAGCERGTSSDDAAADSASQSSSDGLNRCGLITDAEIANAIGPHDSGSTTLANEWALQSCRWTATRTQTVEGYPDGWKDAIEVAVFDADAAPLIRQQARGDPVPGVAEGARYETTHGELWFDCPGGRLCVVKGHTVSGDQRQQIVTEIARLVQSRLR